jgi:hypothetical protein
MKHPLKKAAAFLLAAVLLVQGLPLTAFAAQTSQGFSPGEELFVGEEGQTRQYVSETAYDLAPGVTEYVTYTNVKDGTNQNIDYFCEVDLSQAKIMAGYSGMENRLRPGEGRPGLFHPHGTVRRFHHCGGPERGLLQYGHRAADRRPDYRREIL